MVNPVLRYGQKVAIVGGAATAIIIAFAYANIPLHGPTQSTGPGQPQARSEKLRVVASFFPMYEFARNIAGDRASVSVFIPIGDEPHGWEPTTQEILEVQNSQLFIYNGYGMESFIPTFLSNGNFPNTTFVKASEGIHMQSADVQQVASQEAGPVIAQGGMDPHVWNDPILAEREVRNIADAMEKADPTNAAYYETNALSYNAKLSRLDQDIRSGLSKCQTHTFASFHNAFNYFSQRYNLTDIWISGLAPEAEVAPQDLAKVEDIIKQDHLKVIFSEDLVDPKLADSLSADVGATTQILSPLEGINETEQKENVTFLDKWYQNLDALRYAMGCQ